MWTSLDTNSNKCIVDLNGEVTCHEFSGLSEDPGWKPRCISPRSEKEGATAELPRSWHTPYHGGAQQGRTATWVPLSEFQIQKSHLKSSRSCYCCSLNFPEPAVMDAWQEVKKPTQQLLNSPYGKDPFYYRKLAVGLVC